MKKHTLGDAPIEEAVRAKMNEIGRLIDFALHEGESVRNKWGFVLMVFPLEDHEGRCNYISNGRREDVVTLFKEQLRRFGGAPDVTGRA